MSDSELLLVSLLVGQVMPYVTDAINKYIASSRLRFWVSVLLCAGLGWVFNLDVIHVGTFYDTLLSILTLWFSGQAAYKTYYEGSQMQYKIRKPIIPVENTPGI